MIVLFWPLYLLQNYTQRILSVKQQIKLPTYVLLIRNSAQDNQKETVILNGMKGDTFKCEIIGIKTMFPMMFVWS